MLSLFAFLLVIGFVVDDKGKVDVREADVLDTNAENAFLLNGVDAGELVVLSPMEKSRVSIH